MPDAAFFARGRTVGERVMLDECTIDRDPEFVADSTLNTSTGVLTAASPATVEVYAGVCSVTPADRQDADADEGGAPTVTAAYRASIPADASEVAIGDVLTVTASREDPLLVGKAFIVRGSGVGSHIFRRRLLLDRVVRADAQ